MKKSYRSIIKKAERFSESDYLTYLLRSYSGDGIISSKYSSFEKRLEETICKSIIKSPDDVFEIIGIANSEKLFTEGELSVLTKILSVISAKLFIMKDHNKAENILLFISKTSYDDIYSSLSVVYGILCEKSGIFRISDKETQSAKISEVRRYAKAHRISEENAAELLSSDGKIKESRRVFLKTLYFVIIYLLPFAAVPLFVFTSTPLIFFFLSYIPMTSFSKIVSDRIMKRLIKPAHIPKAEVKTLSEKEKTVLVITSILSDDIGELFDKLERYYIANKMENLYFGLLLDFPPSEKETLESDKSKAEYVKSRVDSLSALYGDHFFAALRCRKYSESERKYIGRERKRGALCDFTDFVVNGNNVFLFYFGSEKIIGSKYIITLDSDSEPTPGSIKKLIGAMIHPENKPVIKNGRVVSGYAVMQPACEVLPEYASMNRFSVLSCGSGGIDSYSSATFDLYQSLFKEGIYCGKGIYDSEIFDKLLKGAFSKERILSHDLLEGSYLRCAFLSDVNFCDTFPKTPVSFFSRLHRWIRGDIQALGYAFSKCRNSKNEIIKNPISSLSKYKLFDNLRRHSSFPLAFISVMLSLFLDSPSQNLVVSLSVLYLITPLFFSVFSIKRSGRYFYSHILSGFSLFILSALYDLASLPVYAFLSLDATLRSLYRLFVSKRKLLEWTTASAGDKLKNGFFAYIVKYSYCIAAGAISILFAKGALLKILGILWLFFPFSLFVLSKPYPKKTLSKKNKEKLSRWAFDSWKFFEENVNAKNSYLPPDNIVFPEGKVTSRTSPTNIGMYLSSLFASLDFGFINRNKFEESLSRTIETLEKMPKMRGHLYNWYDTESLSILPPYVVSSADSGNLAVSLIALANGIRMLDSPSKSLLSLSSRAENLALSMDFSFLFSKKKSLFYISAENGSFSDSYYDLYMSESRLAGFFAISKGDVPAEFWNKLSRPVIGRGGSIGIASWSGTAFEYFMPMLFLPIVRGSLTEEALYFAVKEQSSKRHLRMWGVSECSYNAKDSQGSYLYKACGIKTLAFDPSSGKDFVVSPYSAFLMLPIARGYSVSNLDSMKDNGLYGRYGFYEGADFTKERDECNDKVVRCYMAHHVGMSIIASANAVFDGIFVKRFSLYRPSSAYIGLLNEKIPAYADITKTGKGAERIKNRERLPEFRDKLKNKDVSPYPEVAIISNNSISSLISDKGGIYLFKKDKALSFPFYERYPQNEDKSVSFYYSGDKGAERFVSSSFSYSDSSAVFRSENAVLRFSVSENDNLCKFTFSIKSKKDAVVAMSLIPALTEKDEFLKRMPFSFLKIDSYIKNDILFIRFRDPHYLMGIYIKDFDYTGFEKDRRLDSLMNSPLSKKTGPLLSPFVVLKKTVSPKDSRVFCDFILAFSENEDEIVRMIEGENRKSEKSEKIRFSKNENVFSSALLKRLIFPKPETVSPDPYPKKTLWKYGISAEKPILSVFLPQRESFSEGCDRIVELISRAYSEFDRKNFNFDLVFILPREDEYYHPAKMKCEKIVSSVSAGAFIGKGIFFVPESDKLSVLTSSFYNIKLSESSFPGDLIEKMTKYEKDYITDVFERNEGGYDHDGYRVRGGFFDKNGFTLFKKETEIPWAYIYSSPFFGTVLSSDSIGFTFLNNASESRLSFPSYGDRDERTSERILLKSGDRFYDLSKCAYKVNFGKGCALFYSLLFGKEIVLSVGVDIKLPVKMITVSNIPENCEVIFDYKPDLNSNPPLYKKEDGDTVFYKKPSSVNLSKHTVFLKTVKEKDCVSFLLGIFPDRSEKLLSFILEKYKSKDDIIEGYNEYADYYSNLFSNVRFSYDDKNIGILANYYLPYQVVVSRLRARTGRQQQGGAYGFRDQLQDTLSMLFYDPDICKRQIIRCAGRQYTEGDVQHWWVVPKNEENEYFAMRSKCSDDMLYLPFVLCEYIEKTSDYQILDIKVRYVESDPLSENESKRCEYARKSKYKESIYFHALRAIEYSLKFGENGLILMGSGDWNDSFDKLGEKGKGTSVFNTLFEKVVIEKFIKICEYMHDEKEKSFLLDNLSKIDSSLEKIKKPDRFPRAFSDSGKEICDIDLLPQAFGVFADIPGSDKFILNAYSILHNDEYGLLRLFIPPFSSEDKDIGYVSSYCEGFRENSGQYSHAAIWASIALFKIGEKEKAMNILREMNPIYRSRDKFLSKIYLSEPYALCGDIYYADGFEGRGGWSHYTGSASWYLKALIEFSDVKITFKRKNEEKSIEKKDGM